MSTFVRLKSLDKETDGSWVEVLKKRFKETEERDFKGEFVN